MPSCDADVAPDGVIDINDLIWILNWYWGPCGGCAGDISGPWNNGIPDGIVNINDVIYLVSLNWGPCE